MFETRPQNVIDYNWAMRYCIFLGFANHIRQETWMSFNDVTTVNHIWNNTQHAIEFNPINAIGEHMKELTNEEQ